VSNISVFPSFFSSLCALVPPFSSPFDATGPLSVTVLSSPPPPRCRPLFVNSQSALLLLGPLRPSALDDTPTLAAQVLPYQYHSLMKFLDGSHYLCIAWHSYGG